MDHSPFQNNRGETQTEYCNSRVSLEDTRDPKRFKQTSYVIGVPFGRISLTELAKNQNKGIPVHSTLMVLVATDEEKQHLLISRQIIEQTSIDLHKVEEKLEELKTLQSIFFSDPSIKNNFESALESIKTFHTNIESMLKNGIEIVLKIFHTVVLDSFLLDKINSIQQKLRYLVQQFAIYQQELRYFITMKGQYCCFLKLFILYQPAPQVIFKSKSTETPLSVVLLSGSFPKYELQGPVYAHIMESGIDFKKKNKDKSQIENNIQRMDGYQSQATFNSIRINVSSRMALMYLKFSVKIKQYDQSFIMDSDNTNPIIVITHENQWVDAQIKLFVENCFQSRDTVSWYCFINNFHTHFLALTKQLKSRPDRSLSFYEIRYIHKKIFNNAETIKRPFHNTDNIERGLGDPKTLNFLIWIGNIQRAIHFKRHIHSLWSEGYIFALLSKKKAQKCLESQGVGTFLLRFSETQGGSFAIAYCSEDQDEKVKHYLIKNEEIGPNKSIPDYIQQVEQFQYILKLDNQTGDITRCHKDTLQKYFSKKREMSPGNGSSGYIDFVI